MENDVTGIKKVNFVSVLIMHLICRKRTNKKKYAKLKKNIIKNIDNIEFSFKTFFRTSYKS